MCGRTELALPKLTVHEGLEVRQSKSLQLLIYALVHGKF
jgi:hypothetical protein